MFRFLRRNKHPGRPWTVLKTNEDIWFVPSTKIVRSTVRAPKWRLEPSWSSESAFMGTRSKRKKREVMGTCRKAARNMATRR